MFYIEYRRQVASLQMHLIEEELRLVACRRLIAPEMIGAADETILTGIAEIIVKQLSRRVLPSVALIMMKRTGHFSIMAF